MSLRRRHAHSAMPSAPRPEHDAVYTPPALFDGLIYGSLGEFGPDCCSDGRHNRQGIDFSRFSCTLLASVLVYTSPCRMNSGLETQSQVLC